MSRRIFGIVISLLGCAVMSGVAVGQSTDVQLHDDGESSKALIAEGRRQLFASNLDEASSTFNELIRQSENPQEAVSGFYHLAVIEHWKAMFEQTQRYVDAHDRAVNLLLREARYLDDPQWRLYYTAEANLQKTLVAVQKKDFASAALHARRAFGAYNECLAIDPSFVPAYKGRGFMKIAVGSVPEKYRWVLRIFGFSGSVQEGLAEMRIAAETSAPGKEEAQIYFAFADIVLNGGMENGTRFLEQLVQKYPESPVLVTLAAFGLLRHQKASEALDILDSTGFSFRNEAFVPTLYFFYLADTLFRLNRFEEAERAYLQYDKQFGGENLRSSALFRAGLAREMQGDREGAVDLYRQIQPGSEYDSDEQAVRWAAERMRQSLSAGQKDLLLAQNAYDAGQHREAIRLAENWNREDVDPDLRSEARYRTGRALHALGEFENAIDAYQDSVNNPGLPGTRWAPWSQLYIGYCQLELGQSQQAKDSFRAALRYPAPFDFRNGLEQQARSAISKL